MTGFSRTSLIIFRPSTALFRRLLADPATGAVRQGWPVIPAAKLASVVAEGEPERAGHWLLGESEHSLCALAWGRGAGNKVFGAEWFAGPVNRIGLMRTTVVSAVGLVGCL